jgi:short-subunit dehydrogenase
MQLKKFSEATILVTGAGSGIGLELVRQLYPWTKKILAVDISEEKISVLRNEFPELEGFLIADLSEKTGNQLLIDWVKSNWVEVNFCFANAGRAEYQEAEKQNWQEMDRIFQLNVFSPIQLGLALKSLFPNASFRHVITCSAIAYWAVPGYSIYGATKSALLQWARTIWSEKSGNWLSLVFPIATSTGFFEAAGTDIPKAFPIQKAELVAKKILSGTLNKQVKIFPSPLFRGMLLLNNFLPVILPFYQKLEYLKFRNWLSKHSGWQV